MRQNPTGCISYPYLALHYPYQASDPNKTKNRLSNWIREINRHPEITDGLHAARPDYVSVHFGIGLYSENTNPMLSVESLEERCRHQAEKDLLDYLFSDTDGKLQYSERQEINTKPVFFPPEIDFQGYPSVYYALYSDNPLVYKGRQQMPSPEQLKFIFFSSQAHYKIFQQLAREGYIDDQILRSFDLNPGSMGEYRESLNTLLRDHFNTTLEGYKYTTGYALGGKYRYRHNQLIELFNANLAGIWDYRAERLDWDEKKRDKFAYKVDESTYTGILSVHQNTIKTNCQIELSKAYPFLTFIGRLVGEEFIVL